MGKPMLVVSCEHGGNTIPGPYKALFKDHRDLLDSHRGYDPGALALSRMMASGFNTVPYVSNISRLLVDLNRSKSHPELFSEITRLLNSTEKKKIIEKYYLPYRIKLEKEIRRRIHQEKTVIHISSHSFTPVLKGSIRSMDIGLLYDSGKPDEKEFCRKWKKAVLKKRPDLNIRCNAPYKGSSDGLTTYFRSVFPRRYLGIELELNQHFWVRSRKVWKKVCEDILESLRDILIFVE